MIGCSGRTCFAADECVAWIQRIGFATAVSLRVDHCLYAGLLLKEAEHKKAQGESRPGLFYRLWLAVYILVGRTGAHALDALRRLTSKPVQTTMAASPAVAKTSPWWAGSVSIKPRAPTINTITAQVRPG